jgi:hypothetical protein
MRSSAALYALVMILPTLAACSHKLPAKPGDGDDGGAAPAPAHIGARVLLLNPVEYDNTVAALLGDTTHPGTQFEPPSRQNGFLENAAQVVDDTLAAQLFAAAQTLAATAVQNSWATLVTCDPTAIGEDACAKQFIDSFSKAAFRRPVTDSEKADLFNIYTGGRAITDFKSGIAAVIQAALVSEPFLYRSEIGDGTIGSDGTTTLTPYETASALSYLVLASPPDATLMQAADADALATADQIGAQAKRLLVDPRAVPALTGFVTDWLEISSFAQSVGKDPTVYPLFTTTVKSMMWAETTTFVGDWLTKEDGSLQTLLTANYSFVDKELGALYGVTAATDGTLQRVTLPKERSGILMQSSVMSTFAHSDRSAPVKRGVFIRRQILCETLPPPPANLNVKLPPVDPTETTRQLFDAHGGVPGCASCHNLIQPVGDPFEDFDGIGAHRTTDNGHPVDTAVVVVSTQDINGPYPDAPSMVHALSTSKEVESCFKKQFLRFAAAERDDALESTWLTATDAMTNTTVANLLVAYVQSDLFLHRSAQ